MKKILKKLLLVFFLILIYMYSLVITDLPSQITLIEGEELSIKTLLGMTITQNNEVVETISTENESLNEKTGKITIGINLFNQNLKNIDVDVLPETTVIPIGNIAGIKLYTSGVLVVGMSEIEGVDNQKHKPYEKCGIEEGDTIISVDNVNIENTEDLIEQVNNSNGNEVKIKYMHENDTLECSITPIQTSKTEYKLGLWVRDSAARCWYSIFF